MDTKYCIFNIEGLWSMQHLWEVGGDMNRRYSPKHRAIISSQRVESGVCRGFCSRLQRTCVVGPRMCIIPQSEKRLFLVYSSTDIHNYWTSKRKCRDRSDDRGLRGMLCSKSVFTQMRHILAE